MNFTRRGICKSTFNKQMLRAALEAGKTVFVMTPDGNTKQKMHTSGLILVTPLPDKKTELTIIKDDYL